MKMLLILCASLCLVSCKSTRDFPLFPSDIVRTQYALLQDRDGSLVCVEYDIVSVEPYRIKRKAIYRDLMMCNGVGGFKPEEFQAVKNWTNDAVEWVNARDCRLRE
jgi:hypothetical protein